MRPARGCTRGLREAREITHRWNGSFWRRAAGGAKMLLAKVFPVRKHTTALTVSHLGAFFVRLNLFGESCGRCEQVGVADCSINQISRYQLVFWAAVRISFGYLSRILQAARYNRAERQAIILGQGRSPRIIKSNKKA